MWKQRPGRKQNKTEEGYKTAKGKEKRVEKVTSACHFHLQFYCLFSYTVIFKFN